MGIYIPNIKKPKNCAKCPCNSSDLYCLLDRNIIIDRDDFYIGEKCPIIEIKDNILAE